MEKYQIKITGDTPETPFFGAGAPYPFVPLGAVAPYLFCSLFLKREDKLI